MRAMNDILRAQLKRMSQPGADGLLAFMQYAWPAVRPGERLERAPAMEAIAEVADDRGISKP